MRLLSAWTGTSLPVGACAKPCIDVCETGYISVRYVHTVYFASVRVRVRDGSGHQGSDRQEATARTATARTADAMIADAMIADAMIADAMIADAMIADAMIADAAAAASRAADAVAAGAKAASVAAATAGDATVEDATAEDATTDDGCPPRPVYAGSTDDECGWECYAGFFLADSGCVSLASPGGFVLVGGCTPYSSGRCVEF